MKKHKPEEIIGKLREVEIVLDQGGTAAEACRRIELPRVYRRVKLSEDEPYGREEDIALFA
ncbi:hypothetical protein JUN65_03490 [Gluconacetobacter azotocaptans]|nr:hypothetical protein [Gluconacetobacter azotocaptans]